MRCLVKKAPTIYPPPGYACAVEVTEEDGPKRKEDCSPSRELTVSVS